MQNTYVSTTSLSASLLQTLITPPTPATPELPVFLPSNLRQIFQSLPPFMDILLLLLFFMIIFAILGECPASSQPGLLPTSAIGQEGCILPLGCCLPLWRLQTQYFLTTSSCEIERGLGSVARAGLEPVTILPQSPECWDCTRALPPTPQITVCPLRGGSVFSLDQNSQAPEERRSNIPVWLPFA